MKRDLELVRSILLAVEEQGGGGKLLQLDIPGHSKEEIAYHVKIMANAGLLDAEQHSTTAGPLAFPKALTWAGHEFLDDARNETIWKAAKKKLGSAVASVSLEVFKAALVNVAKAAIGLN